MKEKKIPQRQCVGCREMKDKQELIRLVCGAEGKLMIDRSGRAAGRGAYLCRNPECLARAVKTHALERILETRAADETYEILRSEMMK